MLAYGLEAALQRLELVRHRSKGGESVRDKCEEYSAFFCEAASDLIHCCMRTMNLMPAVCATGRMNVTDGSTDERDCTITTVTSLSV